MPATNTIEIILQGVDHATDMLSSVADSLEGMGRRITSIGAGLTALTAPLAIGLGAATQQALAFDEALTNVQAVSGRAEDEIAGLAEQLLDIASNSRYLPQDVAETFYDVAGSVADVNLQLPILEAGLHVAQAGSADLGSTVSALTSIMNAYGYSQEEAARAGDVLTRTVGMGVGTMTEFSAALPKVAGLAASVGIEFQELAGAGAFLTTKGFSASIAFTQLQAVITALLNPNEKMKKALAAVGIESGSAALEMYGLTGTLERLNQAFGGSQDEMAAALGSIEAMQGAVALGDDSFASFFETFVSGIDGATAAAEGIQMSSPAAQLDLLRSKLSAIGIEIGEIMLPRINQLVDIISPIIERTRDWVNANPELASTIIAIASAASVAGPVLFLVGRAISSISTVVSVASIALGALLSPVGLLIAGGTALASVLGVDVFGGISTLVDQITRVLPGAIESANGDIGLAFQRMFLSVQEDGASFSSTVLEAFGMGRTEAQQFGVGVEQLAQSIGWFAEDIQQLGLADAIRAAFGINADSGDSWVEGVLVGFGMARDEAEQFVDNVGQFVDAGLTEIERFISSIGRVVQSVVRATQAVMAGVPLGDVLQTLLRDILPAEVADSIGRGVEQISTGIQDMLGRAVEFVTGTVIPGLQRLADWFMNDTLPAVVDFIQTQILPGVQRFFDFLGQAWEQVRPALEAVAAWFITDALPAVVNFIQTQVIPGVQHFFDMLGQVWEQVRPALESLADWFMNSALPAVVNFIEQSIIPGVKNFINLLVGIWEAVQPSLEDLAAWFVENGLPMIQDFIQGAIDNFITPLINIISGIWQAVQPALQDVFDWFVNAGLPAIGDAINAALTEFILPLIDTIAGIWNAVSGALGDLLRWFSENGVPVIQAAITTFSDGFIQPLLNTLSGFWESVRPGLEAFQAGVETVFNWLRDNVIQPFINIVTGIRDAIDSIFGAGGSADAARSYIDEEWGTGNVFPQDGVAGKPAAGNTGKGQSDLGTGTPFGNAGTAFDAQVYVPREPSPYGDAGGGSQLNWQGDFVINGQRVSDISDEEKAELVIMALELLRGD